MNKSEIHAAITRNVISAQNSQHEVLVYMVLLHTHDIRLHLGVTLDDVLVSDPAKPIVLPAITHRHAAEVVASLWPMCDKRGKYEHWYSLYNIHTPYEVVGDIPPAVREHLEMFKKRLLADDRIEAISEA